LIRVMDKRTVRRDPTSNEVVELAAEDWRSRIEVTLETAGGDMGGHGVDEIALEGKPL